MFLNSVPVGVVRANHLHHFSVEFNSFMNGIIQPEGKKKEKQSLQCLETKLFF